MMKFKAGLSTFVKAKNTTIKQKTKPQTNKNWGDGSIVEKAHIMLVLVSVSRTSKENIL